MTEKTKKAYRIYLSFAILFALALTAVRSYAVLRYYDLESRYFELGAALPNVVHALAWLSLIFALLVPLTLGKGKLSAPPIRFHLPTAFTSALVAFLLIAFATLHISDIGEAFLSDKAIDFRPFISLVVSVIAAAIGSVSFILSASFAREISAKKAITTLCVVVFAAFYSTILYFDRRVNYNDPQYVLAEMTLVAIAFFFLFESRLALARPKPATRVGLGLTAMILAFSSSVPNLLFYLVNRKPIFENPMHDFLIFAFALYILARLFALITPSSSEHSLFFKESVPVDEESVSSVGQISFFGDDAAPAPDGTSPLLTRDLSTANGDLESEEAKNLFGAPEEKTAGAGTSDGDLLDPIASDLLGPIDDKEGKR